MIKTANPGEVKLGQQVHDILTGVKGSVVAITDWVYGCRRVTIQPYGLHEGKPLDCYVVDEPSCEILDATPAPKANPTHGDRPASVRRSDSGHR